MNKSNFVLVSARAWFFTALAAALLLGLLVTVTESRAQNHQVQTANGGNAISPNTAGIDARINVDINPEDYIENFSAEVQRAIDEGRELPPIGHEEESRAIERALLGDITNNRATVALQGEEFTGKSHAIRQYVVEHPSDIVYRVKVENFGNIPTQQNDPQAKKAAAFMALKNILKYLEKKSQAQSGKRPIVYLENLSHLMEGGQIEIKPAGALTETVAEKRKLRILFETSAAILTELGEKSETFKTTVEKVELTPPHRDMIVDYLRRYRSRIEKETGVSVSEEAMVEAARLTDRFFKDDPFRKAYQVVGYAAGQKQRDAANGITAANRIKGQISQIQFQIESLEKDLSFGHNVDKENALTDLRTKLNNLNQHALGIASPDTPTLNEIDTLEKEILNLTEQVKQKPTGWFNGRAKGEYERIVNLIRTKTRRIEHLRTLVSSTTEFAKASVQVTPKDIQLSVSEFANVDVATISSNIQDGVKRIAEMGKELYGIDHLIKRATQRISTYLGLQEIWAKKVAADRRRKAQAGQKPIWRVLIPGRTGTAKTEFAKVLARTLGMPLVRIDLSTYTNPSDVSGLIGARPGYVGFEAGGVLTEPVRKSPYAVILLDEIDRAHPDVLKAIIYPLMDRGEVVDGQGRLVKYDKAIIIGTTNAGERFSSMSREKIIEYLKEKLTRLSDKELESKTDLEVRAEAVKSVLKLERGWEESMVGRFEDVLPSNNITLEVQQLIAKKLLTEFNSKLETQDIKVRVTENAMRALVDSFDPAEGGRSMETFFNNKFQDAVFERFGREVSPGDVVVVDSNGGAFEYIVTTPEYFNEAKVAGDSSAAKTLSRIEAELARRGKALTPETRPGVFRMFSDEFMVRNATAKILKRFRK